MRDDGCTVCKKLKQEREGRVQKTERASVCVCVCVANERSYSHTHHTSVMIGGLGVCGKGGDLGVSPPPRGVGDVCKREGGGARDRESVCVCGSTTEGEGKRERDRVGRGGGRKGEMC